MDVTTQPHIPPLSWKKEREVWHGVVTPQGRRGRLSKRKGLVGTIPAWRQQALARVVQGFTSFPEGPQSQAWKGWGWSQGGPGPGVGGA